MEVVTAVIIGSILPFIGFLFVIGLVVADLIVGPTQEKTGDE